MRTSMSRKGECWDNAVTESFWNTVKREVLGARKRFLSISEAIEQTESWISYYNAERPHSAIRMMAPLAYEAQLVKTLSFTSFVQPILEVHFSRPTSLESVIREMDTGAKN